MRQSMIEILWPNGNSSFAKPGDNWLDIALDAGIEIPTGCLGGSCGACEIEVNGKVVRACINVVPKIKSGHIKVDFALDQYW